MSEHVGTERAPQACDTRLFPAERLLFAALRAWATARVAGERPHTHVANALSAKTSPRAATTFLAWIQAIEAGTSRPLALTCPDCGGLSTDAQRLIVACGLAPTDGRLAGALLAPLLRDASMVVHLSRQLNTALAETGWHLPIRGLEGPQDSAPTLH